MSLDLDSFVKAIPEGRDMALSVVDDRAYLFNREGDVVSTKLRPGENRATLAFRLRAALLSVSLPT